MKLISNSKKLFLLITIFAMSITQNSLIAKAEDDSHKYQNLSEDPGDSNSNQYLKYAAIAGGSILGIIIIGTLVKNIKNKNEAHQEEENPQNLKKEFEDMGKKVLEDMEKKAKEAEENARKAKENVQKREDILKDLEAAKEKASADFQIALKKIYANFEPYPSAEKAEEYKKEIKKAQKKYNKAVKKAFDKSKERESRLNK